MVPYTNKSQQINFYTLISDSKQMHPVVYCAILPLSYEPDLLLKCRRLQESIYHFLSCCFHCLAAHYVDFELLFPPPHRIKINPSKLCLSGSQV